MGTRVLSLVIKRPELEVDHSPSSIAEIEIEWNYTSIRAMYPMRPTGNLYVFRRIRKIAKGDCWLCHVCLVVRPSVRMEQLGSQRSGFHESLYFENFSKIC